MELTIDTVPSSFSPRLRFDRANKVKSRRNLLRSLRPCLSKVFRFCSAARATSYEATRAMQLVGTRIIYAKFVARGARGKTQNAEEKMQNGHVVR